MLRRFHSKHPKPVKLPSLILEAGQRAAASGEKISVAAKTCSDYLQSEHLQSGEAVGNYQILVML